MTTPLETTADYTKAIAELMEAMPPARRMQLYEFALFLNSRPWPAEETPEAVALDESEWEAQFNATDDARLAALVASIEEDINTGPTWPMFNKHMVLDWRP